MSWRTARQDIAATSRLVEPDLHLSPFQQTLDRPYFRRGVETVGPVARDEFLDDAAQRFRCHLVGGDSDAWFRFQCRALVGLRIPGLA